MEAITKIVCDFSKNCIQQIVHAVQFDEQSRTIRAILLDDGTAWTPPDNAIGIVNIQKPDGTIAFYEYDENGDRAVVFDGCTATVRITAQALAVAGEAFASISIFTPAGARLTTFGFRLRIEQSVINDDEIISSDYFNILTEEIQHVIAAADKINGSIDIKGTYATLEMLQASVRNPDQGDMYNVGEENPYQIYMFDTTGETPQWINLGVLEGPRGPKGDDGVGFTILGYYASPEKLSEVENPQAGDAYGIGTEEPYDIYVYDGINDTWVNNGPLQGAKGETGPAGPRGLSGQDGFSPIVDTTEITGGHRVTITDATETHTFDILDGSSEWTEIENKPFATIGSGLKTENGALSVDTANAVEEDNTKPITSAAVFVEVGNITALLGSI